MEINGIAAIGAGLQQLEREWNRYDWRKGIESMARQPEHSGMIQTICLLLLRMEGSSVGVVVALMQG